MKQLKISLIIVIATLLFTSCQKNCIEKPPKDLKPINWDGYNDVYTVFWNYYTLCSDVKNEDKYNSIMISGWIYPRWDDYYAGGFALVNSPDKMDEKFEYPWVGTLTAGLTAELQQKLDTCNLTKQCFIEGELIFNCLHSGRCSRAVPEIIIKNVDDIYFE